VTTIIKGGRSAPYAELQVVVEKAERKYGEFTQTFKIPQARVRVRVRVRAKVRVRVRVEVRVRVRVGVRVRVRVKVRVLTPTPARTLTLTPTLTLSAGVRAQVVQVHCVQRRAQARLQARQRRGGPPGAGGCREI